jgi:hypothetical protein
VDQDYRDPAAKLELQLLLDRTGSRGRGSDVLSGLNLPSPSETRRALSNLSPGSLDLVAKTAQKQRNVEQILSRSASQSGDAAVAQVDELTRGLAETAAGDVLFQLAERLRRQGRPELAAEIDRRLLHRHPHHAASEAAALRLVQYWASSEAAAQAPASEGASSDLERRRAETALAFGQSVARVHPALFAEPALRFSLAAAARRRGDLREAEPFFRQIAAGGAEAWRRSAEVELWLMKPTGGPPPNVLPCPMANAKPYLDGKLDDDVWRSSPPWELPQTGGHSAPEQGSSGLPGAAAGALFLAWDEEHLYFAVRCRKAPGVDYSSTGETRTYDAPLDDRDRVDLLIDLDRDYASCYRLTVDHRGWTGEGCLGAAAWNPEWFVAASSDEQTWTVEAAIPLRQLTPRPPSSRDVWAFAVRRAAPGEALAPWSAPGEVRMRPDDFGCLLFE